MDVTGDKEQAEEAMTKWVEGRVNNSKDAYAPVSLDSINLSGVISDLVNTFKSGANF